MTDAEQPRTSRVRRVGLAALVVILLLGPLLMRTWIDGRTQLREAEAAATAGDPAAELRHLGRAARMRLPIAGHDELARARLRERAEQAAAARDTGLALAAWRELRRAILGTRALGVVDRDQLDAANAAIVELMAIEARGAGAPIDRERWAAELDEDNQPRGRSLLAALCFVVWLGACVGFFWRAIDGRGHLEPRAGLRWGLAVLLSLIGWILMM